MAGNHGESLGFCGKSLLLADEGQVILDLCIGDGVEVEALHTGEDGCRNHLRIGGTEDEDHVRRRLFQGFEQRVEGRLGEHVDLVDDIDLVFTLGGGEVHAVDDLVAHRVDAGAAGSIELMDVGMVALGNGLAGLAGAIRQLPFTLLAQQRFGENARHGGFAGAARAAEQVGVAQAVLLNTAL